MTIYGEVVGYLEGTDKYIQNNPAYDKLMLLDILYEGEAGKMYNNLYGSIFTNITCKDIEDFYNQRFEMRKNGNIPWKYETINNFFIDKWRTK